MRVFLYEFASGGGFWHVPAEASNKSLLAEGLAMMQALASDLTACEGVQIITTRDIRLATSAPPNCRLITIANALEESTAIERLAAEADWTLLIAPETGGELLKRCRQVESVGGRLLSPSSAFVEIAGNKQATAEILSTAGVPVPRGGVPAPDIAQETNYPVVVKPVDGCGSQDIHFVRDASELHAASRKRRTLLRCEEFIPGLPSSVAVHCGPGGNWPLPPCEQRLSSDGRFSYLGGKLPLPPPLDKRAQRLGLAAVAALGPTLGYVGVDLVLGDADDGSGDRVIEINPRLTTSYVGLRAASRTNLAAAMLAVAEGKTPDLSFGSEQVEFAADGTIVA